MSQRILMLSARSLLDCSCSAPIQCSISWRTVPIYTQGEKYTSIRRTKLLIYVRISLKQPVRHQLSHHLLLNNRQRLEILFACHQFDQYMKNTYKKGIQTVMSHIILSPIPTQIKISILYTSLNSSILLIYLSCTFGSLFWKYWYTFKVISI